METSARNKMQNEPEQGGVIHEKVRVLLPIENGKVIRPADPTKDRYEFVNWVNSFTNEVSKMLVFSK